MCVKLRQSIIIFSQRTGHKIVFLDLPHLAYPQLCLLPMLPWGVTVVVFHYWVSCVLVDFLLAFSLLRMTLLHLHLLHLHALMPKSGWPLFLLRVRIPLYAENYSRTSMYINNLFNLNVVSSSTQESGVVRDCINQCC